MKECLQCKNEFEAKRDAAKFCSVNCRVKWNRKNGNAKAQIKPFQMQVMYNQIMEAVAKINENKILPEPIGFVTQQPQTFFTPPKPKSIIRSPEQWHSLKRSCDSEEEWIEVKQQIMDADNLSTKQKQLIINTP